MSKDKLKTIAKQVLAVLIVIGTIVVFVVYAQNHPEVITTLASLDPPTLTALFIGYALILLINVYILTHSLKLLGKRIQFIENLLLSGYSSIINFFGPLQSGPGVRAIYLKKKHNVRLRDFLKTTFVFYGFFAIINGAIVALAIIYKFFTPMIGSLFVGGGLVLLTVILVVLLKQPRIRQFFASLDIAKKSFWLIGLGALSLLLVTIGIYFSEIVHIDASVSLWQVIIYTAAANLALFVSLTPGAIGIRESFLLLSQQLHYIETSTVVGASIIDRAFYVGFLGLLFVILLAINSRQRFFKIRALKSRE